MGKQYAKTYNRVRNEAENIVPATYASIAIALDEGGMDYDTISYLFSRSQEIWAEHNGDLPGMLINCFNKTGIQLMSDKQYAKAIKLGLISEDDVE